jgi:hypothetical protein
MENSESAYEASHRFNMTKLNPHIVETDQHVRIGRNSRID